jgi:hypothetical protein
MVFHAFAVRHVEQGQAFDPYFVRSRVPFLSRLLVSKAKAARRYRAARSIARELECRDSRRRLRRMRLILRSGSMAMIVASRLANVDEHERAAGRLVDLRGEFGKLAGFIHLPSKEHGAQWGNGSNRARDCRREYE